MNRDRLDPTIFPHPGGPRRVPLPRALSRWGVPRVADQDRPRREAGAAQGPLAASPRGAFSEGDQSCAAKRRAAFLNSDWIDPFCKNTVFVVRVSNGINTTLKPHRLYRLNR